MIGHTLRLADRIDDSTIVTFVNSEDGLGFSRMGGQESINEKLRRAVGSKLMDCFFGPQPLKGASAPLCSAGTRRTLPHSTTHSRAHCRTAQRARELVAVFHVTSEGGAARHHGFGAHSAPPLCPQARVLVYILCPQDLVVIYIFLYIVQIYLTFSLFFGICLISKN